MMQGIVGGWCTWSLTGSAGGVADFGRFDCVVELKVEIGALANNYWPNAGRCEV